MTDATAPRRGRAHWRVSGRVQGVGFRWFVVGAARRIGLAGDVRNLPDGSVEIRAVGDARRLETLYSAVAEGPPSARVERIDRLPADEEATFDGFDVRY